MGLLFTQEPDGITVIGVFADDGESFECEGCQDQVQKLLETDDSVMLCEECFNLCLNEAGDP